ncbi:hypothetical protein B0H11DRAFT_115610 [Mycena galericulata]|nr:hypothetical protein B0H11DRAFT_115610 [Mycena galericulata]
MRPSGGRTWLLLTFIYCHVHFLLAQARFQAPRAKHHAIGKRDLSTSGLTTASWIWTSAPTTGNVGFIKTFDSAAGKTASSATISMTAVNQFTFWVNGQPIGASGDGANDWTSAQVMTAGLNSSTNTFSVLAVNNANSGAPPPGLLAAIQITYSDGSGDTIVSDSSWGVSAVIPSDFPTPSDTSGFTTATVAAAFGSGSWGSSVTLAAANPNVPSLSTSTWIWSTSTANTGAAVGTVGFRKTVTTPSGKTAQSATLLITVDNGFNLYINGAYVGSAPGVPQLPDFTRAQQFTVGLDAASNTFTIFGENIADPGTTDAGPAGVIAAIRILYSDGTTSDVDTDATWLSGPFTTVPAFLSAADSALSPTFAVGTMGSAPWGQVSSISNVLAAANVPSGPFASGTVPQAPANSGTSAGAGGSNSVATASHASGTGSGISTPSTPVSTARDGSGSPPSSTFGVGSINTPNPSAADSSSSSSAVAGSSSMHLGTIIGLVIVGLAVVAAALALFFWRRKRNQTTRRTKWLSGQLFVGADGHGQGRDDDASVASASTSQRTSVASMRRAEMASLQPQRAVVYDSYPRPPVMMAQVGAGAGAGYGGYPQPPVMSQGASGYPRVQPPLTVQNGPSEPPSAELDGSFLPASTSTASPQPSKLERENMIWQNNAAATSQANSARTSVDRSTIANSVYMGPSDAAYGGIDNDPDGEPAPPSYYAQ